MVDEGCTGRSTTALRPKACHREREGAAAHRELQAAHGHPVVEAVAEQGTIQAEHCCRGAQGRSLAAATSQKGEPVGRRARGEENAERLHAAEGRSSVWKCPQDPKGAAPEQVAHIGMEQDRGDEPPELAATEASCMARAERDELWIP